MTSSGGPPRPKLRSRARGASAPALWPAERRPGQAAPPRRPARADERQRATGGGLLTTAQYGYAAGACSRALLSFPRAVLTAPQLARPACRTCACACSHADRPDAAQAGQRERNAGACDACPCRHAVGWRARRFPNSAAAADAKPRHASRASRRPRRPLGKLGACSEDRRGTLCARE